ncbi:MAG: hypothetical protein ACD_72C00558G0003, partial [uncultured bacterium]
MKLYIRMKGTLSFVLLLNFLGIIILLVFPSKIFAQVIFSDSFDEVNPTQWTSSAYNFPITGWVIQSGMYGYPLPLVTTTNSYPTIWDYANKNISYEVDLIEVYGGVNKNILVKYVDDYNFINVHSNNEGTHLVGYVNTDQVAYFSYFYPKTLSNGELHHYKIDIIDNTITVYIDNELIFDHLEDPIMFENWRIGLRTSVGTKTWFDNLIVTQLDTTASKTVFAPGLMGSWNE